MVFVDTVRKQAQRLADVRKEEKADAPYCQRETWMLGRASALREDWSPEQISGLLESGEERLHVSHEWIYLYVYQDKREGGDLHRHLRCQKPRRKRYGSNDRRGQIRGRVSIDERPDIVDDRSRIGDWEVDTVIGRQGGSVLVTLAERKSRLCLIALSPNKTAEAVTAALLATLKPLSNQVFTLTYDNGKEFAHHTVIAQALEAEGFLPIPIIPGSEG